MFEKPQHMLSCYTAPRFEEHESLLSSSTIPENDKISKNKLFLTSMAIWKP